MDNTFRAYNQNNVDTARADAEKISKQIEKLEEKTQQKIIVLNKKMHELLCSIPVTN